MKRSEPLKHNLYRSNVLPTQPPFVGKVTYTLSNAAGPDCPRSSEDQKEGMTLTAVSVRSMVSTFVPAGLDRGTVPNTSPAVFAGREGGGGEGGGIGSWRLE